MRLILILGLVLVGILEIPSSNDFKTKQIAIEGEVRGEKIEFKEPHFSPLPPPSSPLVTSSSPPSSPLVPLPSSPLSAQSQLSPPPTSTPPIQVINEIILLDEEKELKNEQLELALPNLDQDKTWYLELEIELISTEDALGFDSPSFVIALDNNLAYQLSAVENEVKKISFNLATFTQQPVLLSIWSGNNGDELKDTFTIIKEVKLVVQRQRRVIDTAPINDLVITVDSENYLTLEWSSPQTDDVNLGKSLVYDIRYSPQIITQENWSQAQLVEMFLPLNFAPQSPLHQEIILIKAPPIASGYLVIRSIDSTGSLSPLGKNVLFSS